MSPPKIEYNTPLPAYWKCKAGHEWRGSVAARTLFGRNCHICNSKMAALPIGTKYGCLTIIGDYSVHEKKLLKKKLQNLKKRGKSFCRKKEIRFQM